MTAEQLSALDRAAEITNRIAALDRIFGGDYTAWVPVVRAAGKIHKVLVEERDALLCNIAATIH